MDGDASTDEDLFRLVGHAGNVTKEFYIDFMTHKFSISQSDFTFLIYRKNISKFEFFPICSVLFSLRSIKTIQCVNYMFIIKLDNLFVYL